MDLVTRFLEARERQDFEVKSYIGARDMAKADAAWSDDFENNHGRGIIEAAQEGDITAINYIFGHSGGVIFKAYKRLCGDKDHFVSRTANGEYDEWITDAYLMLLDPDTKGPLQKFNASTYDNDPDANIFTHFQYYYMQYLMGKTKQLNNEINAHGVTGRKAGSISTISLNRDSDSSHDTNDNHGQNSFEDYVLERASFMAPSLEDQILSKIEKEEKDAEITSKAAPNSGFMDKWKKACESKSMQKHKLIKDFLKAMIEDPSRKTNDIIAAALDLPADVNPHDHYKKYQRNMRQYFPEILKEAGITEDEFKEHSTDKELLKYL